VRLVAIDASVRSYPEFREALWAAAVPDDAGLSTEIFDRAAPPVFKS